MWLVHECKVPMIWLLSFLENVDNSDVTVGRVVVVDGDALRGLRPSTTSTIATAGSLSLLLLVLITTHVSGVGILERSGPLADLCTMSASKFVHNQDE